MFAFTAILTSTPITGFLHLLIYTNTSNMFQVKMVSIKVDHSHHFMHRAAGYK
jgi:hypothetical protein